MTVELGEHLFVLLPERAVWWPLYNTLIISDVHVGKSMHFRKSGIAVPRGIAADDFNRLESLCETYKPEQLIITGDLYHSEHNIEMNLLIDWCQHHPELKVTLIKGNHDVFRKNSNSSVVIEEVSRLLIDGIGFTHFPQSMPDAKYTLCGHLHPGYTVRGKGRQHITLPCYYATPHYMVLPAFSVFTGLYKITPGTNDRIYVIAEKDVICL